MPISFVIPVFNEQDSLRLLTEEILLVCTNHNLQVAQIIFVDDGSKDASWARISQLASEYPEIVLGIKLSRNFGKAAALAAGFDRVTGELVCMMDADLQDDPANLPQLLLRIEAGADVVSGYRHHRQDSFTKRLSSWLFNTVVSKLTRVHLKDHNCGLKLFRKPVVEALCIYGEMHRFIPAIAHAKGFHVGECEVHHRPRQFGQSKYTSIRIVYAFFDLLTVLVLGHFRYRPLHLFGSIGAISFTIGFAALSYLAIVWLFTNSIGGRPLLQYALGALIVGCQFLIGGILAEIFTANAAINSKPYLIQQETSSQLHHRSREKNPA